MKILTAVRAAIATCAFALSAHVSAAVLQVNSSGILTGATGVTVGGKLYNVTFGDGTCASLYSGCDASSDFTFQNETSAYEAAFALRFQVFSDSTEGSFNSVTNKVAGCSNTDYCYTIISYAIPHSYGYNAIVAMNYAEDYPVFDRFSFGAPSRLFETGDYDYYNFAKFEIVAAEVPEPSSVALISLAFAGLAFSRRRKS